METREPRRSLHRETHLSRGRHRCWNSGHLPRLESPQRQNAQSCLVETKAKRCDDPGRMNSTISSHNDFDHHRPLDPRPESLFRVGCDDLQPHLRWNRWWSWTDWRGGIIRGRPIEADAVKLKIRLGRQQHLPTAARSSSGATAVGISEIVCVDRARPLEQPPVTLNPTDLPI